MPRFDLCLSPKDVDDDIVQIDTILEALEPGYPPPEIDERRRSRADVKYYESASTTEGSDDTERKERKRLKNKLNNQLNKSEKKIDELEREIKKQDLVIAELDYSDKELADKVVSAYKELKLNLDQQMQLWEEASEGLIELE